LTPREQQGQAEEEPLRQQRGDALPGVLRGPLDGRFGQVNAGELLQSVSGGLEAVDAAGAAGQLLDGWAEVARREARLLVERADAPAPAAAVIVGPSAADDAKEADQVAATLRVIGGSAVAAGAGHAGPLVAGFL
jgi:hypothetical protein